MILLHKGNSLVSSLTYANDLSSDLDIEVSRLPEHVALLH